MSAARSGRSRSRRRSHPGGTEEHEGGMERWLLTYADMITLLLALFVVLFALSSINAKKFADFRAGLLPSFHRSAVSSNSSGGGEGLLQQSGLTSAPALGIQQGGAATPQNPATAHAVAPTSNLAQVAQRLEQALARRGLLPDVAIHLDRRGLVVRMLSDRVFYAVDSAALGSVGGTVVDTMAQVLATVPNQVVVEGYTDSLAITGGPFPSNWALSAMRSVNVVQRLISVDHLTPGRLAATGYGKTRPVAANDTAAGLAANRRVDVVVLAPGQDRP